MGTFFNRINELRGAARCGAVRYGVAWRGVAWRLSVKFFDTGLTLGRTKTWGLLHGAHLQRPIFLEAARSAVCFQNDRGSDCVPPPTKHP
jgi:hypothetical protein